MQSAQFYCQILNKAEEVATLISWFARVCKFIWTNSKPSHFILGQQPPVGQELLIHEVSISHMSKYHIR